MQFCATKNRSCLFYTNHSCNIYQLKSLKLGGGTQSQMMSNQVPVMEIIMPQVS